MRPPRRGAPSGEWPLVAALFEPSRGEPPKQKRPGTSPGLFIFVYSFGRPRSRGSIPRVRAAVPAAVEGVGEVASVGRAGPVVAVEAFAGGDRLAGQVGVGGQVGNA